MPENYIRIKAEAETLDEARELVKLKIPKGHLIVSEKVLSDGKPKSIKIFETTTLDEACEKARRNLPSNAIILEAVETVSKQNTKKVVVTAFDEQLPFATVSAKFDLEKQNSGEVTIQSVTLLTKGQKGFLGIGKTPNQYEIVLVEHLPAFVEVIYKEKVRILIMCEATDVNTTSTEVSKAFTGGLGERYCSQKCYDAGGATITTHLLRNWTGDCSVCRKPISLHFGGLASMVCWKPGLFLFYCGSPSCVDAVRDAVRQTHSCPVCGKGVNNN